jgi:predicted DCC family thiol-disulfide oxidoreductase YuxK
VARGDQRLVILYDGECGFCAWGIAWLLRFDRARQLRPVAIQSEEGARLLRQLSAAERLASWHACEGGWPVSSGGAALAPVLARLPGGAPLAGVAERFPRASESLYRFIATRRVGLGGLISQASKERARALIATRMH